MTKKPPFPEQLKPPRMKGVLSGAGLWAGACIALVSLLVISNSFKGHNGFSPISTWHFPRSSSTNTRNDAIGGGGGGRASGVVLEKKGGTQLGNSSSGGGSNSTGSPVYNSSGDNGKKGVIFGGTQLGNFSSGGTQLGNSSVGGGNSTGSSVYSSGDNGKKDVIFGGTQLGNSSSSGSVNVDVTAVNSGGNIESCDIFDGRWVRDDDDDGSRPYYPAGSCPYIDRDFNCHLNGRPDDGFLKWRWQPNKCDIPSLNGTDFLERLRGKKLVFVGDSLNRNMWESLVCILRQSIRDKKRVYEISGRREFKKKGFYAFRFEDYNCTVDFIGSPFLVRESGFTSGNGTIETLRLDLMDRTTSMYHDADIIVFNTGHWWTHEKTSRGENYYQEGNHVYPRLKVMEAYKRALSTWAKWVDKNIDSNRTLVFFRGYSVTHFRGGQWNSGGQCHSETEPIYNTSYLAKYPSKMKAFEHVLQGMKTPVVYMNISRLTDYRKDGHPSIYGMAHKTAEERTAALRSQDCSHWCLPGVPDVWNELLYASILKATNGS